MELPNRAALEARLGRRLQNLSNRHMRELLALLGSPPNFDAVGPEFWARVKKETEEEAAALLLLLFMASANTHTREAGGDVEMVAPVLTQQAETFARRRGEEVGLRQAVGASIRFDNMRKRVEEAEAGAVQAQDEPKVPTKKEIAEEAEPVFSPGQTIQVTRDETTRARHEGGEAGVKITTGTSEEDLWQTRPAMSKSGPCPLCSPLDNAPRSVWTLVYPQGPPSPHVGCVCVIKYAFEKKLEHA